MAGTLRGIIFTCRQHAAILSRSRQVEELFKYRPTLAQFPRLCSSKYYEDDDDDFTPGRHRVNTRTRAVNDAMIDRSNFYQDDRPPSNTNRGFRRTGRRDLDYDQSWSSEPRNFRSDGRRNRFSSMNNYSDFQGGRDSDSFGNRFGQTNVAALDPSELAPVNKLQYVPSEKNESRSLEEISQYREKHQLTLVGDNFPHPIVEFDDYDFPDYVKTQLAKDGILTPTPIQAQTWPVVIGGSDLIGISQTGSGKTLAFLLPALLHIQEQSPVRQDGPLVLVLAPTRELANQILSVARQYGRGRGIRSCVAYGGASRNNQLRDLDRGTEILVATPGRLNDFLESEDVSLRRTSFLVIDEADRMLDMGFAPQLRQILKYSRPDRQTVMFSATWPQEVQQLARSFLKHPLQMNVGSLDLQANPDITQKFHVVRGKHQMEDKLGDVLEELAGNESSKILMFMQTKRDCDRMELKIKRSFSEFNIAAIHGDKKQATRESILHQFRSGRKNFLVATEVAARGIDVSDITHVINYGFPNDCEQYVHRIGRTGRQGRKGESHTIMSDIDRRQCRQLVKLLEDSKQEVPQELLYYCGRY